MQLFSHPAFAHRGPVCFAGDWHGNTLWALSMIRHAHDRGARVVYQVGDFGLWGGHDGAAYLRKLHRDLTKLDMVCVIVPGNHENYDMLGRFPANEFGFLARPDVDRLWFAPRGHCWMHGPVRFGALGGAVSVDRDQRTPGKSWWTQEVIQPADVDALIANAGPLGVDVLLTHDCPAGVPLGERWSDLPPDVAADANRARVLLRAGADAVTPRAIVHGHWHRVVRTSLTGVGVDGREYCASVFGLGMDGEPGNVLFASLDPTVGIRPLDA